MSDIAALVNIDTHIYVGHNSKPPPYFNTSPLSTNIVFTGIELIYHYSVLYRVHHLTLKLVLFAHYPGNCDEL